MKKYIMSFMVAFSLLVSIQTQAATQSGVGCDRWAKVTYVYATETYIFALINGSACFINGVTERSSIATAASVLSEAQSSSRLARLAVSGGMLSVGMQ